MKCRQRLAVIFAGLLLGSALIVHLDSVPTLWWDEGWTLSVARNWVERGHYGRLLNGNLAPGGLEAGVTTIAPIAFSFRVLGIGIWQGRLVGLVFLLGALASTYLLAKYLFSHSVANFALVALLLMNTAPNLAFPLRHLKSVGRLCVQLTEHHKLDDILLHSYSNRLAARRIRARVILLLELAQ